MACPFRNTNKIKKTSINNYFKISNRVKVAILFTAGTNCDEETIHAFERAGAKADRIHLNLLKKKKHLLKDYQILVIPGGFTYR